MSYSLVHYLYLMKIPNGPGWKKDKRTPGLETIAITATKTGDILYSFFNVYWESAGSHNSVKNVLNRRIFYYHVFYTKMTK